MEDTIFTSIAVYAAAEGEDEKFYHFSQSTVANAELETKKQINAAMGFEAGDFDGIYIFHTVVSDGSISVL